MKRVILSGLAISEGWMRGVMLKCSSAMEKASWLLWRGLAGESWRKVGLEGERERGVRENNEIEVQR